MANNRPRVVLPDTPADELKLMGAIYQKHQTLGNASPLQYLEDINWADHGPKIATAQSLQGEIEELEKTLESLYRQRDLILGPLRQLLKASRDVIMGIFRSNPKKAGEVWGLTVNDTPRPPKPTAPKA
ncbi:MAG: hypothetical protein H7330_15430 [Hymenobacteraceae bacterium]|nr:hypothetical protein [Hymenobacteraceae bacterium]